MKVVYNVIVVIVYLKSRLDILSDTVYYIVSDKLLTLKSGGKVI